MLAALHETGMRGRVVLAPNGRKLCLSRCE
jgi:hypothetical protein